MDGVSLLNVSAVPPDRPIFALSAIQDRKVVAPMLKALSSSGPPNYGAASATAIIGNKWFELSLIEDAAVRCRLWSHAAASPRDT